MKLRQGVPSVGRSDPLPVRAPFCVLRDTREQNGWHFRGLRSGAADGYARLEVETKLASFDSGDYSIDGFTEQLRIERKSPEDLLGTLTRGRDRFEAELDRLATYPFSAVVVEAEFSDLACSRRNGMTPRSFVGSVVALSTRFPSRWYFAGGRRHAEVLTYRIFERWWKDRITERKE
jgi:DNA excision repair protein ERCC-4